MEDYELRKKRLKHSVKKAKEILNPKPSFTNQQKKYILNKVNEIIKEDCNPSLNEEQKKYISKRLNEFVDEIPTIEKLDIPFRPSTTISPNSPIIKRIFGRQ